jgi:hypothetical protein
MPTQLKQVISSFLTWSAYEKLAMSMTWQISPGAVLLLQLPYTTQSALECYWVFLVAVFPRMECSSLSGVFSHLHYSPPHPYPEMKEFFLEVSFPSKSPPHLPFSNEPFPLHSRESLGLSPIVEIPAADLSSSEDATEDFKCTTSTWGSYCNKSAVAAAPCSG